MKKKDNGKGENKGLPPKADQQAQELRRQAEQAIWQQEALPPENLEDLTPEQSQKMLYELQVHQVELAMQNEELRTSRVELEESQARFFELYDLAPAGYLTLSEQGFMTLANLTFATLLGVERNVLINKPLSRYILKEDQDIYYRHRKKLFESGENQQCELRMVKADGVAFWAKLQGNLMRDEAGEPQCRVVLSNISERIQAQEALHESEQFLRSTLDGLSFHIAVVGDGGVIVLTNKAYRDFAVRNKIEPSAVSEGRNYLAVCDAAKGEDSREASIFAQGIREVLSGKRLSFELEYPCHSPEEQRWFLGRVTPFTGDGPKRVVIAHENITKSKEAEKLLFIMSTAQQNLNSFMLELYKINDYDELIKTVVTQIDQLFSPIVTSFGEYDQDARVVRIKELKTNHNVLDLLVKVGGEKLLSTATPVSNEMHKEIMTDRVKIATNSYELFGGAIPKAVSTRIDKALKIKCYFGFSYIVDDQVFGTTFMALDREPDSYLTDLLKGYAHFVSISLKRIFSEQALRKTTIELKTITDNMSELVTITDPEGRLTYASGNHDTLYGYTKDELLGRYVWDIIHAEDAGRLANLFRDNFSAGRGGRADYRVVHKDGSLVWVETVGSLLFDDHGKPSGALFVTRDITDRKKAEDNLKKIEWMLSQKQTSGHIAQTEVHDQGYGDLTELNDDGIILQSISPELLRNFSNDYMELLGTSSAIYEASGDYAFGIFSSGWCRMMDRASRQLCKTSDNKRAMNSGHWLCHESCWTNCSREAILKREPVDIECNGGIRLYAVPIIASGEVIGAINFGYGDPPENSEKLQALADIYQVNYNDLIREAHAYETRPPYIIKTAKNRLLATARLIGSMVETKQAEEMIIKNNEELEQRVKERTIELEAVNKELASFAYSISHDFRAPLRALNAFSASLTEKYNELLDEQGLHYLNRINNASLYMSDLVDDLLSLSRITRAEVKKEALDIGHLAKEILRDLQEAEPERRVKVNVAPGLTAKGDSTLLKAALANLIDNAWKFSSQKEQAEIEVGRMTINGEEAFFVSDNGVGFNMAYADKLFGAFQRLHGVNEFPGTGIGLASVQRIVSRHGGRVWAESEVGKGATFYFTLKNNSGS